MAITFWDLTVPERRCLDRLSMDEPLSNMPGVGQPSVDRLIQFGLVEKSPNTPFVADMHYRRTVEGDQVYEKMWRANRIPR
ncbi:hypothetical protein SAMN05444123_11028 [Rhodopseudomonas pseudopalustris]|uniref:Uncharacterized protein n=1 Tax=Rhodopseudomonas pseudopalustris TaxID=1513892 RepID=A0A1H8VXK6_9BRAD|nr:hypothetical protein SAMN05444123_11028 [Rhodopseudomonas pseudopalustris]